MIGILGTEDFFTVFSAIFYGTEILIVQNVYSATGMKPSESGHAIRVGS